MVLLLASAVTFDEAYRAGLRALQQNQLVEARTNLEAAATLGASNGRVWLALAQTYWKLRENGKADEAVDRAAKLSAGDTQILKLLAVFYSETGQLPKSCNAQAEYTAAAPRDSDAVSRAIECFLRIKQPESAIRIGTRSPGWESRADIRDLLGKAYSLNRQWELAAPQFQAAIRLNPYEEQYYFDAADSFLQQQKFEAALGVLQEGKRKFDKSAQLELALGVAYYGLRRFPEAAAAFQRTIALAPDIEQPYLFLGKMLDQIPAKIPELIRVFEAYEKAHPENYAGYLLHAKALLARPSDDTGVAEMLLRKACTLNTRIAEPHFQLGVVLESKHQFEDAAKEFESAASRDSADPATHYHLARVYDRMGKSAQAKSERERHRELLEGSAVPATNPVK